MRTLHVKATRRLFLILVVAGVAVIVITVILVEKSRSKKPKFNLEEALKRPDLQLNETAWGYSFPVFPRTSMIADEYKQPSFDSARNLNTPLGIKDSGDWSQDGQSLFIDQLLGGKEDGFYVEIGADDGEHYSNSLFFEIEPNQESFATLLQLNRKALALNSCVSPTTLSESFTFVSNPFESHNAGFLGGISEFLELTKDGVLQAKYEQHFADGELYNPVVNTKRCTPLIDLLPSNVDTIDYLSLDTEGSELAILKTIPFGKLKINVISVDVSSITGERRDEGLYDFLWKHGYRKAASLTHDDIFYLSSW
ncbi:unnamed protein product [Oikopleura dioica]|uniref:Methyltransferase FkbM domain-containing protein n=1 Tax=Oikopleura dioica TaxID=34765 RepID=E4XPE6_OIKDI|nr:unnamed protein product [Oikopleura dioica]